MKGIILYKSNYGSTRQYARWLSEETGYGMLEVTSAGKADILGSDTVVVGCPVFAYKPMLAKWIRKNWKLLADKKVVLYTTSGASPDNPVLQEGYRSSLPPEILERIKYFPQGGRLVMSDLSSLHRFLMRLGQRMEKDPKVREEMVKDTDRINRDGLRPVVEYLKSLETV